MRASFFRGDGGDDLDDEDDRLDGDFEPARRLSAERAMGRGGDEGLWGDVWPDSWIWLRTAGRVVGGGGFGPSGSMGAAEPLLEAMAVVVLLLLVFLLLVVSVLAAAVATTEFVVPDDKILFSGVC